LRLVQSDVAVQDASANDVVAEPEVPDVGDDSDYVVLDGKDSARWDVIQLATPGPP
jgi:hypothetical protein